MPRSDSLSRWIMRSATANPPAGREDWARAMKAEFEAMDGDRLGWAFGCWTVMAGWRLRTDALFLIALVAIPGALTLFVFPWVLFGLRLSMPYEAFKSISYGLGFSEHLLIAALLAAWRPDQPFKAALASTVVPSVLSWVLVMKMNGRELSSEWVVYDAAPLVGYLAIFGASWIGAAFGAWLGRTARQARRST